jgi:hypothetical protein
MQVRLTAENEKLLGTFRELCRLVLPSYNEKEGSIVNGMLTDKLRAEIERIKVRKGK